MHNIILRALKDPKYAFKYMIHKGNFMNMSDKEYLELMFKHRTGYKLNLENPKTFNEKLQWLKLYNRKPEYTMIVDKYEVRKYISQTIGAEYLNTLIGVWDRFEEIDFAKLPSQFVLKCTHDSGGLVICDDKSNLDIEFARNKINKCLKRNYYYSNREWPYKNVKPRIICEKFLTQKDGDELRDYRFFCFNGEPKFVSVDFSITDKRKTRRNLYDLQWSLMDEEISYPKETNIKVDKPEKFEKMIELSKKVSSEFPHARVDFYYIDNRIIFGEITFFHQSGMGKIRPQEFNVKMGSWLELPIHWSKND